ncbi:hypothetical protein B0H19DRAFT_1383131 [Mycena capillaripes]|nr:hypothetical protein B0H19DRAFT_1383131 [Mycena capillaripes]
MIALLFTVLALAVSFILYARYHALKNIPPTSYQAEEPPEIDTPPSGIDSAQKPQKAHIMGVPTIEPNDASVQVSLRHDRAVQPQFPATRKLIPAPLPVDDTTDITPHERRILQAMNTARSEQFQYIRQMANKFQDAVNGGDIAAQKEIRLSVGAVCSFVKCGKPCLSADGEKWTPKRYMGCLGNYYCSRECQTADWKPIPGNPKLSGVYHKDWCKIIRDEYMPLLPRFLAQLAQFPWGRLERDGTFSDEFLRARFGVLDSDYRTTGFWAIPERLNPHDVSENSAFVGGVQPFMQSTDNTNLKGYAHGRMMLAEEWPSDIEGWKLDDETLIPHIFFTDKFWPPARARKSQVRDWKSWYEWRGLSLESPAAILVDHVLTVYYLLTETLKLKVVDPHRSSGEKQIVDVHYLGAETELNYLPLFSELALLLPNTHINITFFSPATPNLMGLAKQSSLIARQLRPFKGVWDRSVMMLAPKDPDVFLALNAGILAYSTWYEVVSCAAMANIPFAYTDYAQQSVQ